MNSNVISYFISHYRPVREIFNTLLHGVKRHLIESYVFLNYGVDSRSSYFNHLVMVREVGAVFAHGSSRAVSPVIFMVHLIFFFVHFFYLSRLLIFMVQQVTAYSIHYCDSVRWFRNFFAKVVLGFWWLAGSD